MQWAKYEWPDWPQMLLSIGIALALGAIIGYDRERKDKPAGLRTHSLVTVASCLAMIVAVSLDPAEGNDAARGVVAVMTGIGFLGAGAIMQRGETIYGLKTGATIWTAGAVGVAVGAGWYAGAVVVTVAVVVIMMALTELESALPPHMQAVRLMMDIPADEPFPVELTNQLQDMRYEVESISVDEPNEEGVSRVELIITSPAGYAPEVAVAVAHGIEAVNDVEYELVDDS